MITSIGSCVSGQVCDSKGKGIKSKPPFVIFHFFDNFLNLKCKFKTNPNLLHFF